MITSQLTLAFSWWVFEYVSHQGKSLNEDLHNANISEEKGSSCIQLKFHNSFDCKHPLFYLVVIFARRALDQIWIYLDRLNANSPAIFFACDEDYKDISFFVVKILFLL